MHLLLKKQNKFTYNFICSKIVLEAVEGSSVTGDIAVDDVQLAAGLCSCKY